MSGSSLKSGNSDRLSVLNGSLQSLLLPARDRFRDLIIQRISTFESFWIDFRTGKNPEVALGGVIALSHKIAGVAETLGFPEAGKLAATIEYQCGEALDRAVPAVEIWPDVEPSLIALMDELESILDK